MRTWEKSSGTNLDIHHNETETLKYLPAYLLAVTPTRRAEDGSEGLDNPVTHNASSMRCMDI